MMADRQPGAEADANRRCRLAFSYRLDGDLRFISHHDTLRLFRRALARADLPVRFSQGFNPHPRMSIPLPRPVGIATNADIISVEFDDSVDPGEAVGRLEQQMPAGIHVTHARTLKTGEKLIPGKVHYYIGWDGGERGTMEQRVAEILQAGEVRIIRTNHKNGRSDEIDIRPFIDNMEAREDGVHFCLKMTQAGSAKPAEIAALVTAVAAPANHLIRRMHVEWRQGTS